MGQIGMMDHLPANLAAPGMLRIKRKHWLEMLKHIRSCAPLEGCGLLGGAGNQVEVVVPVTNIAQSPVRYRMDPEEQLKAMLQFEDSGYSMVGIYHSHPGGPSGPSASDLEQAAYPEAAYLIWSPKGNEWNCQAFDLFQDDTVEIPLLIIDDREGA